MKKKIVKIEWVDASSEGPWVHEKKIDGLINATTIGMLIRKNKEAVTIAHTRCPDGDLAGVFHIPRGCVKSIEYLTEIPAKSEGNSNQLEEKEDK